MPLITLLIAALWAVAVIVTLFVEVSYRRKWSGVKESSERLTPSQRKTVQAVVLANAACLIPLIAGQPRWTAVTWLLVLLPVTYLAVVLLLVRYDNGSSSSDAERPSEEGTRAPLNRPGRDARPLQRAALGLAGLGAVALVAWLVTYQPPISEDTLLSSMRSKTGQKYGYEDHCERRGPKTWSCSIGVTSDESGADYTITTTPEHCWSARIKRHSRRSTTLDDQLWPRTASGCTSVLSLVL